MYALVLGLLVTGGTPDAQPVANTSDWQGLDAEIQNLAASINDEDTLRVGAILRTRFTNTSDLEAFDPTAGTQDLSGFDIQNARVSVGGDVGRYSFFIQTKFDQDTNGDLWSSTSAPANSSEYLNRAWVDAPLFGESKLRVGYYYAPVLHSSMIYVDGLMMVNRSILGTEYAFGDAGAMWYGGVGPLHYYLSMQNGSDTTGSEYNFTGRGVYDFGKSVFGANEGALGYATNGFDASLGIVYQNDGSRENGDFIGGDLAIVSGPLSLTGEVISYNEQYDSTVTNLISGAPVAGTSPTVFTGSWLLGDTNYEVAARWENVDDALKSNRWTLGLNYYMAGVGHKNKIQFNMVRQLSDDGDLEGNLLLLGWTIGM